MVNASILARSRRELDQVLVAPKAAPGSRAGTSALAALAGFKKREREVREREYEKSVAERRIPWEHVREVVELTTAVSVHAEAPRPIFYVLDALEDDNGEPILGKDGKQRVIWRPYMTDDECELAALRDQLRRAPDYGPEEYWLVSGRIFGATVTAVYHGPLSALRALWPDLARRRRMVQAGAKDLESTVGVPVYVERLPRAIPRRRRGE